MALGLLRCSPATRQRAPCSAAVGVRDPQGDPALGLTVPHTKRPEVEFPVHELWYPSDWMPLLAFRCACVHSCPAATQGGVSHQPTKRKPTRKASKVERGKITFKLRGQSVMQYEDWPRGVTVAPNLFYSYFFPPRHCRV